PGSRCPGGAVSRQSVGRHRRPLECRIVLTVTTIIRPFMVYYLLAVIEFGAGGWALYAILAEPGSQFPTAGVLLVGVGLVALFFAVRGHRRDRLRKRLLATGDGGTAEILQLVQTGATRNNVPLFRITLLINTGAH